MNEFKIIDISKLPEINTVCEPRTKEIIKLQDVSMLYTTLKPLDKSPCHKHRKMHEVYFIAEGEGHFYLGNIAFEMKKNEYVSVPPATFHFIENFSFGQRQISQLEYLTFAVPYFNQDDIEISQNNKQKVFAVNYNKNKQYKKRLVTSNGIVAEELMSPKLQKKLGFVLTLENFTPKEKPIVYRCNKNNKVCYILSGEGYVKTKDLSEKVKKGSMIYVPKGEEYSIENSGINKLELLCLLPFKNSMKGL